MALSRHTFQDYILEIILQLIKGKQKLNFEIALGNLPVQSQCLTKHVPKKTTLKS